MNKEGLKEVFRKVTEYAVNIVNKEIEEERSTKDGNQRVIKKFWEEYQAYTMQDFEQGDNYYYDKIALESAVVRLVHEEVHKAKYGIYPSIKCNCKDCAAITDLQAR